MARQWRMILWLPIAVLIAAFQAMPADVCEQVIRTVMAATHSVCEGLGRNEACYGNHLVDATQQPPGSPDFKFNDVGDIIDITGLESLRLSAMDLEQDMWGVALMRMRANIPSRLEASNVTMVLFGDVEVRNQVRSPYLAAVRTRTESNVNVRRYPEREAYVMTTLQNDEIAIADGRTEDNAWIHVQMLESGETGWVSALTVEVLGNRDLLRVVNALSADFGPMQAFFLNTGDHATGCEEAPDNGVLIQTPEGVATVDLWINEVKIRLGSTAFIQARPNDDMVIQLVEGATQVEALGVDQVALAGTEITIPMNESLQPQEPPSLPQAYTSDDVAAIPVEALERPIEVAPPLDQQTLDALVNANLADVEPTIVNPTSVAPISPAVPAAPLPSATPTVVVPTRTNTPIVPTLVPPTNTASPVPPTQVPPTATPTVVVPTQVPVVPTATLVPASPVPPTANLVVPTDTSVPSTPTTQASINLVPANVVNPAPTVSASTIPLATAVPPNTGAVPVVPSTSGAAAPTQAATP